LPAPPYGLSLEAAAEVVNRALDGVPGQVAGDALLCRTACVGGDGAIERIAFPQSCGAGRTIDEIASVALELLSNVGSRAALIAESQRRALDQFSFQAARKQLSIFFARIGT